MFMSAPVMSHMLYRLTDEGGRTRLKFSHRAIGQIPPEFRDADGLNRGWSHMIGRISEIAEKKGKEAK